MLERSIPVIVLQETFAKQTASELVKACVEMTLVAYGLVAQKKA